MLRNLTWLYAGVAIAYSCDWLLGVPSEWNPASGVIVFSVAAATCALFNMRAQRKASDVSEPVNT